MTEEEVKAKMLIDGVRFTEQQIKDGMINTLMAKSGYSKEQAQRMINSPWGIYDSAEEAAQKLRESMRFNRDFFKFRKPNRKERKFFNKCIKLRQKKIKEKKNDRTERNKRHGRNCAITSMAGS